MVSCVLNLHAQSSISHQRSLATCCSSRRIHTFTLLSFLFPLKRVRISVIENTQFHGVAAT